MEEATRNKGGAPKGNTNAVKHGARSNRRGIVLAKVGRKLAQAYFDCAQLRLAIEDAIRKKHGGLTLMQIGQVQSVIRLELSARACEQTMRDHPDMPPDQLRQNREAIVKWTLQRDKLMAELLGDDRHGNGSQDDDPWAVVDQQAAERVRAAQQVGRATGEESSDQGNDNATGNELGPSNVEAGLADVANGGDAGEVSTHAPMLPNLPGEGV
jgi:hypothetical protein